MTTILQDLRQRAATEVKEASARYRQLIVDYLAGTVDSPERAGEILKAAGKTADDLEADAERHEQRQRDVELVAKREQISSELKRLDVELSKLTQWHQEELNRIHAKFHNGRETLLEEMRKHQANLSMSHNAEARLADSPLDPELKQRERYLCEQLRQIYLAEQPLELELKAGAMREDGTPTWAAQHR